MMVTSSLIRNQFEIIGFDFYSINLIHISSFGTHIQNNLELNWVVNIKFICSNHLPLRFIKSPRVLNVFINSTINDRAFQTIFPPGWLKAFTAVRTRIDKYVIGFSIAKAVVVDMNLVKMLTDSLIFAKCLSTHIVHFKNQEFLTFYPVIRST